MAATRRIVFYSWQSDLPNSTNRTFIENALKKAAKTIKDDETIEIEPVIERDTQGVAGSPEIARTIFQKIEQADIFVCDISIINLNTSGRLTPNPNVLIELGFAIHALGEKRIVMVLNKAYGDPELLPFDLRTRRNMAYKLLPEMDDRSAVRKSLENDLTNALLAIFREQDSTTLAETIKPLSLVEQVKTAIEGQRQNQNALVRKYMSEFAASIEALTLTFTNENRDQWDTLFDQALNQSDELVVTFTELATYIAEMEAVKAASAMYKGFEHIFNLYTFPNTRIISGPLFPFVHDVAKFLGHELFVTFFACLIKEERWGLIGDLLQSKIYGRQRDFEPSTPLPFYCMETHVVFLTDRNYRLKLKRLSVHNDILAKRHSEGDIAPLMPLEQFADADYFLFLRAQIEPSKSPEPGSIVWAPWSLLSLKEPPRYLKEAQHEKEAQQLALALGVNNISILRERLVERAHTLATAWPNPGYSWHYALDRFDFNTIGTK